jgi:histidyl-tRNA synthetase
MAISTQPYKGARDFYPEDKRVQKYMFSKMREVAERFGYEEYDAPILEPTDLFLMKGNQEIIDEQTYTFKDRGDRSVTIRTEMTPTVSRMVAGRRQELAYPLRWYSIPNLWRYERTQRGRLREFWQLNVDIFGVDGVEAEHEIIQLVDQMLKSYGAKPEMYSIHLNSRKLTEELFGSYLGLDNTQRDTLIRLIDRMKKMEASAFQAQVEAILTPSQREKGVLESLLRLLKVRTIDELPSNLLSHPSVLQLRQLGGLLGESRIMNARFDITLMRGFDYYTDIVFEVFDADPENNRSMFGGGRYDGLVGMFGVESIPTVGVAAGDVTLQNFLESHDLLPKLHSETDAYVILVGDNMYEKAQPALNNLRKMGVNLAVDTTGRKLEKQIKSAVKKGLHYAIFIGETELASEQFKLRNLVDGSEEAHGLQRIVTIVKDRRHAGETPVEAEDDEDLGL